LSAAAAHAASGCKAAKVDLPVTVSEMRALVSAKINGESTRFVLDSGAFFSMISSATASQFKLRLRPAPDYISVKGIGGDIEINLTTVKEFSIAGQLVHNLEFLVGGSEVGANSAGLLGQNLLEVWDVEYDLANGVVRLFKVENCKNTSLAYWTKPGEPLSTMEIESITPAQPHTIGTALLNGKKIRIALDTGAGASLLSLKAAERAGVHLDTPGVAEAGYWGGIGRGSVRTYIAPFSSLKLGDDEEIQHPKLRIADISMPVGDMLLGIDFFLSHRVLVSNSQRRLYFTYNGGPVFDLSKSPAIAASKSQDVQAPQESKKSSDELGDAAGYARRGSAHAVRKEFGQALADFKRACELDPNEPEYFFELGSIHMQTDEPALAMADLERALSLKPDFLPALMSRSQLRMRNKDVSGAVADLDAASRGAAPQADLRFTLAEEYESASMLPAALAQFDLWIVNHRDDSKMVSALNGRCWIRAMQGSELDKALDDCNHAARRTDAKSPGYAAILNSRGLVRLRLGDYDKAIADYDDSLKASPKNASSLYGKGLAELRKKKVQEGEADIATAVAMSPQVAEFYDRHGIAR
jgi:tetratricopeptide (TPR) repeat protein/predicted aspartyl protease